MVVVVVVVVVDVDVVVVVVVVDVAVMLVVVVRTCFLGHVGGACLGMCGHSRVLAGRRWSCLLMRPWT